MTSRTSANGARNGVDHDQATQCLERILASPVFANSSRLQQFLRFVMEETLAGRAAEIKETVLAVQVFGRSADFDSHTDSVVRVQATHLRKRLREYYRTVGANDPIVIDIPSGGYVPVLQRAADTPGAAPRRRRRTRLLLVGIAAIVASAAALWVYSRYVSGAPTSIAVLPFMNLDGAADSDYLTEGIAEDLMTALARSPALRVVARTSAFQFRGKNVSAQSIGRDLGARVLLEGSIRRDGDHLKITARLVNAKSGFDLWSEAWDGRTSEAPLFEEQIVRAIRKVLRVDPTTPVTPVTAMAGPRLPALGAQEPYWRGRILLSKPPDVALDSIRFLEQAIAADPQYPPAHAALATAYVRALYHGFLDSHGGTVEKVRRVGERALELDPASSEARSALAMLSFVFAHDWAAAERDFSKALDLNPSDARAHMDFAMGMVTRSRFSEALAHLEQARALDPLSFTATNDLAIALYCAGRYDESIATARRTLAAEPEYKTAHVAVGRGLAMKDDFADALAEFQEAVRKYGRGAWILGRMGYTLARAGRTAEALAMVKEIEGQQGPPIQVAFIFAGAGDKQHALDALDRAFEQGNVDLNFMAVDPMLASLHAEPRFVALRTRMGL